MLACLWNCIQSLKNLELIVVDDEDEERIKELKAKKLMIKSFAIFQSFYIVVKIMSNIGYVCSQSIKVFRHFVILNLIIEISAITLLLFILRPRKSPDSSLLDMHYGPVDQNNEQNEASEELKNNGNNDNHELVPTGRYVPASEVAPEAMPLLYQTEISQNSIEQNYSDSQDYLNPLADFSQVSGYQNASRTPQMPHSDNDDGCIYPSINVPTYPDNDH